MLPGSQPREFQLFDLAEYASQPAHPLRTQTHLLVQYTAFSWGQSKDPDTRLAPQVALLGGQASIE